MQGIGKYKDSSGRVYVGEFSNGKLSDLSFSDCPNGKGLMTWPNKTQFEGMFKNGQAHGEGVYTDKKKNKRKALFKRDKKVKYLD